MSNSKRVMAIALGMAVLAAGVLVPLAASSQGLANDDYGYCGGGPEWMSRQGQRGWMGPGMMGDYRENMGPGALGGPFLGFVSRLDLSASQRSQVNRIWDELRTKHWALMGKIVDDRAKLRDLNSAGEPDPKAVGSVYADISKLRQEMLENRVQAANRTRALLTKDQRQQLDTWRRGSWAATDRGPGMGRGPANGE